MLLWLLLVFLGLIWSEVKQLWDEGAKAYVQDMWNILDFITNSLYIATFTLKLVAYIKVCRFQNNYNLHSWYSFDDVILYM